MPGKWQAAALYAALTLILMYPISLHPGSLVAGDGPDTHLGLFVLSWDVRSFTTHPLAIFDANTFYPNPRTLAYQDNLIGSALFAAPVLWLTGNPVAALNAVCLLATVLCGLGGYVLGRRVGLGGPAALVCGLIFAFCPPRFFRYSQVGLAPMQWIPFTLASLHAYFDGGRKRDLRFAAAFFTLQTLTSSHGAVFLLVGILLLIGYRLALGEPVRPLDRLRDLGVTGTLLFAPALLSYLPYRLNQLEFGLRRGLEYWSRTYESFLASPTHLHAYLLSLFGLSYINEVAWGYLFPGYLPLLLAGVTAAGAVLAAIRVRPSWRAWRGRETAIEIAAGLAVACASIATAALLLRRTDAEDAVTSLTALLPWAVCSALLAGLVGVHGGVSRWPGRYRMPLRLLAIALLVWTAAAGGRSLVPAADGLAADYYTNDRWAEPRALASVDALPSTNAITERWRGGPPDVFTARWTGYVTVDRAARYRMALTSDDGVKLWVGPRLVIDNAEANRSTAEADVDLTEGPHRIVLEYAQRGGAYALAWMWAEGDGGLEPVPAWRLSQHRAHASAARLARGLAWAARMAAMVAVCGGAWWAVVALRARWSQWGDVMKEARNAPVPVYLLIALVSFALAMGPPYGIWQYVYTWPGFSFVRAPLRFMSLGVLGIAVLASFGFERLASRMPPRRQRLAAAVLGLLLIVEFNGAPLFAVPYTVRIPEADRWIASHAVPSVIAEVPIGPERYQTTYMLHSTAHWQRTVAGYGGIRPALNEILNAELRTFPDEASLARLQSIGVTHVVVHMDFYPPDEWPAVDERLRAFEGNGLSLVYSDANGRVYAVAGQRTASRP